MVLTNHAIHTFKLMNRRIFLYRAHRGTVCSSADSLGTATSSGGISVTKEFQTKKIIFWKPFDRRSHFSNRREKSVSCGGRNVSVAAEYGPSDTKSPWIVSH